jgi:hypothetical protein
MKDYQIIKTMLNKARSVEQMIHSIPSSNLMISRRSMGITDRK